MNKVNTLFIIYEDGHADTITLQSRENILPFISPKAVYCEICESAVEAGYRAADHNNTMSLQSAITRGLE